MQTTTIRTTVSETRTANTVIPSPFKWLRDFNAAFAAFIHFKELTAEQLRDIGVTKKQQDQAFLRQFAPKNDRY